MFNAQGQITFAFQYVDDLSPVIPVQQFQTVTITATSKSKYGTKNAASKSVDFIVRFLNPCLDSQYVQIVAPNLDTLQYTVSSGAQTYIHPAFTQNIRPFVHDFCGPIVCSATYDSNSVGISS